MGLRPAAGGSLAVRLELLDDEATLTDERIDAAVALVPDEDFNALQAQLAEAGQSKTELAQLKVDAGIGDEDTEDEPLPLEGKA